MKPIISTVYYLLQVSLREPTKDSVCLACVCYYHCGIVIGFEEKPKEPKGTLANMGVYVCNPSVLEIIPKKDYSDIGEDLLPQLLGKMNAYESNEYFCDIGTIEGLKYAERTYEL